MPLIELDTENADRDLTSIVTVLTDTPSATLDMHCQGLVYFGDGVKDLDGTGGNFELTITVGGQTVEPQPQIVAFSTATRAAIWTTIFPVPANDEVILRVKSPNGADTDVDIIAFLYDVHGSAQLVDDIWDEVLTAATHNVATSAGRRLRDIASDIVLTGTSPDSGGVANTAIRIELDGDASAVDGAYDPAVICIIAGTGAGQARQIFEYDGSNKYAYINRSWKVIPDDTSEYVIVGHSGNTHVNEGLVTGGSNNTITLNSLASGNNDTYIGQNVFLVAGIGEDQNRTIKAYNGTTKVATVDRWVTNPVNGETIYAILPNADITSIPRLTGIGRK